MEILIDPHISVNKNISNYFNKGKKAKSKIPGVNKAIGDTKRLIKKEEEKASIETGPEKKIERKKEWYEKFHWFFTKNNFLVVAGKDMKSNQVVVTRYLEINDLYFHADIQGAPSVILKEGQKAEKEDIEEAASFAASYSSAWKKGAGSLDVYYVTPDQVTKSAPSGEYLPKGGFIIKGHKEYVKNSVLQLWVSFFDEKLQILPYKPKEKAIQIKPGGNASKNALAKSIFKTLSEKIPDNIVDTDWLMQRLPNGSSLAKGD